MLSTDNVLATISDSSPPPSPGHARTDPLRQSPFKQVVLFRPASLNRFAVSRKEPYGHRTTSHLGGRRRGRRRRQHSRAAETLGVRRGRLLRRGDGTRIRPRPPTGRRDSGPRNAARWTASDCARLVRRLSGCETVPIIAVSGYSGAEYYARARAAGIHHYLLKTSDPDRLRELLAWEIMPVASSVLPVNRTIAVPSISLPTREGCRGNPRQRGTTVPDTEACRLQLPWLSSSNHHAD